MKKCKYHRRWLLLGMLLAARLPVVAQAPPKDSVYCNPGVVGLPRTKGISFKYEQVVDYGIYSRSANENLLNNQNEVQRNQRLEFKARVPVLLKDHLSVAVGFKYFQEKYQFENRENAYPFYQALQGKTLRSIGGTLYVVKPFRGNTYALLRASADLNGDYHLRDIGKGHFLRVSITPLFGWKRSDYLSYGVGLSYNYVFGRPVISPVLAYNQTFSRRWGLELLLPSSAKLRYTPNPRNFWYATAELNGGNYTVRLNDAPFAANRTMYLQRSEVRLLLNWEHELYDFLWLGLEAGLRNPINFNLAESVRSRRDPVVRNRLNNALLLNASLFLVPPKKYVKK